MRHTIAIGIRRGEHTMPSMRGAQIPLVIGVCGKHVVLCSSAMGGRSRISDGLLICFIYLGATRG
jgi:hypothetical protein